MDFGKLDPAELETADLSLPVDSKYTRAILKKGKGKTQFFIGCAKWGRKDWIGTVYPPGTKEKDFLRHYAQMFNSIEFNGFFYKRQTPETVRKWKESVPPGFKFCPKFTQGITHYKRLKNAEQEVDTYLTTIHEFGDTLGALLLMPHPQMGIARLDVIEKFVEALPGDVDVFLELRHPSWYEGGYDAGALRMLSRLGQGTVITDAAGRRDCAHMQLSKPECFIRFVGNSLHPTDYTRIDEWVQRLKVWTEKGLERCYFFMHHQEELHSPELTQYFIEQMNAHCGTDIPPVEMQDGKKLV